MYFVLARDGNTLAFCANQGGDIYEIEKHIEQKVKCVSAASMQ